MSWICLVLFLLPLLDFGIYRCSLSQVKETPLFRTSPVVFQKKRYLYGSVLLTFFALSCCLLIKLVSEVSYVTPSQAYIVVDTGAEADRIDPQDRASICGVIAESLLPYPTGLAMMSNDGTSGRVIVPPTVNPLYIEIIAGERLSDARRDQEEELFHQNFAIVVSSSRPDDALLSHTTYWMWVTMDSSRGGAPTVFLPGASGVEPLHLDTALIIVKKILENGFKRSSYPISSEKGSVQGSFLIRMCALFAFGFFVLWMRERHLNGALFVAVAFMMLQPLPTLAFDERIAREFEQAYELMKLGSGYDIAEKKMAEGLQSIHEPIPRQRALLSLARVQIITHDYRSSLDHMVEALSIEAPLSQEVTAYAIETARKLYREEEHLSDKECALLLSCSERLLKMVSQERSFRKYALVAICQNLKNRKVWRGDVVWPFLWLSEQEDLLSRLGKREVHLEEAVRGFFFQHLLSLHRAVIQEEFKKSGFGSIANDWEQLTGTNDEDLYRAFLISFLSDHLYHPERLFQDVPPSPGEALVTLLFLERERLLGLKRLFGIPRYDAKKREISKLLVHILKESENSLTTSSRYTPHAFQRISEFLTSSLESETGASYGPSVWSLYFMAVEAPMDSPSYEKILALLSTLEHEQIPVQEGRNIVEVVRVSHPSLFSGSQEPTSILELSSNVFLDWLHVDPLYALSWWNVAIAPSSAFKATAFSEALGRILFSGAGNGEGLREMFLKNPLLALATYEYIQCAKESSLSGPEGLLKSMRALSMAQWISPEDVDGWLKVSIVKEAAFFDVLQQSCMLWWKKTGSFPTYQTDGAAILARMKKIVDTLAGGGEEKALFQEMSSLAQTLLDTLRTKDVMMKSPSSRPQGSLGAISPVLHDLVIDPSSAVQIYRDIDEKDRQLIYEKG